jgi:hypothetical protein
MERKSQNIVAWRMSCAPMMDGTGSSILLIEFQCFDGGAETVL